MKKIIIIASLVVVVLVGGITGLYFFWAKEDLNTNQPNLNNANGNTNVPVNENLNTNQAPDPETNENANISLEDEKEKIEALARTFAERYGSYSNKNNFENLAGLLDWMTAGFQTATEKYIASEKAKLTGEEPYFAVTSKVISLSLSAVKEAGTDAAVTLERTERNETSVTDTYFQDLTLQFKKINGLWLVNSVAWQEKTAL